MIAIIDYDIGNLAAIANMLQRVGVSSTITADAKEIKHADRIILPGNGHFDTCVSNLRASGLLPLLEHKVLEQGTPLLGICVGAQMLGEESEEGHERGLGWLHMRVKRFPDDSGLRVPHMGWNEVQIVKRDDTLVKNLGSDARFYFVHSYYLSPDDPEDRLLEAEYGIAFAAAVSRGNIAGVQFHPEKSHRFGKMVLDNFARAEI